MATIILSAVGTAIGGPIGGAVGSLLGQAVDRRIFAPKGRVGPRLADLSMQSSSYGQPLARIYGTLRVAGSLIWATDIVETSHRSGGGKKSGGKTTSYTYSASLAIALAARPLQGIGRIWGDGKLLRNASGEWLSPTGAMRFYPGSEDQPVDPLIASAEGIAMAPAYRGVAYVVFEDLQLAAFANHVPSLTFEVIADGAPPAEAAILADMFFAAGADAPDITGLDRTWPGLGYSGGTLRAALEMLGAVGPIAPVDDGERLRLQASTSVTAMDADVLGAHTADTAPVRRKRREQLPVDRLPGEIDLSYYDTDRDYQAGLQRARRGAAGDRVEQIELPAALDAGTAKALTEKLLADRWARRTRATVTLPWRMAAVRPGDRVRLPDDPRPWRVKSWTCERMTVELGLELIAAGGLPDIRPADGGRAQEQRDSPHGPTLLKVLDLPPLFDSLPVAPRLWLATAGPLPGWRGAELSVSAAGSSWQTIGAANGASVIGETAGILPVAAAEVFDLRSTIDIELAGEHMLLEGCSDTSLLAGANLALLGNELIQFGAAEAIGTKRYRLSRLLRGRRGTEAAIAGHAMAEAFIMLDPAVLTPFDPPLDWLGTSLAFRAAGAGDPPTALPAEIVTLAGRALQPPSPVHLRATRQADGAILFSWIRRSRQGWAWTSGSDAPLAEESERYRLNVKPVGGAERTFDPVQPWASYALAEQIADCGTAATMVELSLTQLSALAGLGAAATATINLPSW